MAAALLNPLESTLRQVIEDLRKAKRPEPRTTRDVDLAVAVADDREAEALIFRLQSLGYTVLSVLEQPHFE